MLHKDTLYYGCIPLLQICTFLWQVKYKRTDMLNHKLVQTWIDYKLRDVVPELVIYMLLYILFLANLTTFSLLLPRPGPLTKYCKHIIFWKV